jgi:hypothetical protein
MKTISNLNEDIRRYINLPRKQHYLLKSKISWHKLCVSLDAIDVTELAIGAYIKRKKNSATIAEKYLSLYGVLQALFVQQDAIKNLCSALAVPYRSDAILDEIRNVRHRSVGHPTSRYEKEFITIGGHNAGSPDFSMAIYSATNNTQVVDIKMRSVIDNQWAIVRQALKNVLKSLREEEMTHRAEFRKEKLENCFPQTLSYAFEKILTTILGHERPQFGLAHLDYVIRAVGDFKAGLKRRDALSSWTHAEETFDEVEYPMTQLKNYLATPTSSSMNDKDAHIFWFFLKDRIERLQKIASEFDEEYASNKVR